MFASGWFWALGPLVLFLVFPGHAVVLLLIVVAVGYALASILPEQPGNVTIDPENIDEELLAELNHRLALRRIRERRERLAEEA